MGPLSDIFGGDEDSTNQSNSETVSDFNSAIGLDANSSSENWQQDEDGNQSYDSTDNSLSLDTDTDSLLSNVSDSFASSDDAEHGN